MSRITTAKPAATAAQIRAARKLVLAQDDYTAKMVALAEQTTPSTKAPRKAPAKVTPIKAAPVKATVTPIKAKAATTKAPAKATAKAAPVKAAAKATKAAPSTKPKVTVTYTLNGKVKRLEGRNYTLGYLAQAVIGKAGATATLRAELLKAGISDPEHTSWTYTNKAGVKMSAKVDK